MFLEININVVIRIVRVHQKTLFHCCADICDGDTRHKILFLCCNAVYDVILNLFRQCRSFRCLQREYVICSGKAINNYGFIIKQVYRASYCQLIHNKVVRFEIDINACIFVPFSCIDSDLDNVSIFEIFRFGNHDIAFPVVFTLPVYKIQIIHQIFNRNVFLLCVKVSHSVLTGCYLHDSFSVRSICLDIYKIHKVIAVLC